MSKEDPGCQHSAGVLENGELSETTYNQIVQNIINAGELGFAKVHPELPCASSLGIPTAKGLVPPDLHNKEKYPDFHKNTMGSFRDVALALDVKGQFSLPFPFFDPFALGLKFGLDVSFDLPDLPTLTLPSLALALNLKIPDLLELKLPDLVVPQIPKLDFSIYLPKLDAKLLDLKLYLNWPVDLPNIIVDLAIPPDINLIMEFLKVPPNPCPVITKMTDSKLFGPAKTTDLTKLISIGELSSFTSKCATVTVASLIVGDGGPSGVTGTMGTNYGFRKAVATDKSLVDGRARNALIEAFKQLFNRDPTLKEVQFPQIIAILENGYGTAWPGRKTSWPSDATTSNNWGNLHGGGDAGSFSYEDYDANGKKYKVSYAKFSSPVAGAKALLKELYVRRPYILDAIKNDQTLYKPIFLMSSRAVLGSDYKLRKASSDAVIPMSKGGLTYYEASPEVYLKNSRSALARILKNLKEETDFNVESNAELPYDVAEADDKNNFGSGTVAETSSS